MYVNMGQSQDRIMNTDVEYEEFDENGENGLLIAGKYLPEELIAEILCHVDYKSLLNCQLVCKRWMILIQSYVWRKKAEVTFKRTLPSDKDMPWSVYYFICKKKPFERNLLKNHSGQYGVHKHWKILSEGGDRWKVENPPAGVPPLPANEAVFEGKQTCFATSYYSCIKAQVIDLEAEGLTVHVLDVLQPTITVSEWYSCRFDCPALYDCCVKLLDVDEKVLDEFQFHISIEGEKQNEWLQVSHEFQNYGPGLRKISFCHGGMDTLFWAGHYGSKMAGACVYVKMPDVHRSCTTDLDAPPVIE